MRELADVIVDDMRSDGATLKGSSPPDRAWILLSWRKRRGGPRSSALRQSVRHTVGCVKVPLRVAVEGQNLYSWLQL